MLAVLYWGSVSALSEPLGERSVQVRLVLTDPHDMAARSQQHGWHVQAGAMVDDVRHPVPPTVHGEVAGPVEQQPAAVVHPLVEAALLQADVRQAPAEQFVALAQS